MNLSNINGYNDHRLEQAKIRGLALGIGSTISFGKDKESKGNNRCYPVPAKKDKGIINSHPLIDMLQNESDKQSQHTNQPRHYSKLRVSFFLSFFLFLFSLF